MSMTPEQLQAWRWEREIDERNRPLTDEELDAMFPEGYKACYESFPFVIQIVNGIKIINIIINMICVILPPGTAPTSRLCAHPHPCPQVSCHANTHWWYDWLPHAG